jgi:nitroreductase
MQFLELVQKRYSVRSYTADPVPTELLTRAIEAARLAPSASNTQPWQFIVVDQAELRRTIGEACRGPAGTFNKFVPSAPALVVALESWGDAKTALAGKLTGQRYSAYDIGMAVEHFCLQAAEDNLGTCILGWFNAKRVRRALAVPRGLRPALIISVGYPKAEKLPHKKRKSVEAITHWNGWHGARTREKSPT